MNESRLQQIFTNYIDRFETFNSDNRNKTSEYYKWLMPDKFKSAMDRALSAESETDFNSQLDEIKKITHGFIDSGNTLPLEGLAKLAKEYQEWETVQEMFQKLYADDHGNLEIRQRKIESFLEQSHRLREKHNLGGVYKSDFRSVTAYLFLYDPDHNYIYKPTHAQSFQDWIEIYDDFGEGDHVNLKAYYRMCDQLVEAIRKDRAIQDTEKLRASKFKSGEEPYKDAEWHMLAYDIIYSCSAYHLYPKKFKPISPKERKEMQEKQKKAKECFETLQRAQEEKQTLDAAMQKVEAWFCIGKKVAYKSFGKAAQLQNGVIVQKSGENITIDFEEGNKMQVSAVMVAANGYLRPEEVDEQCLADTVKVLKNKSAIESRVSKAETDFNLYRAYL